MNPWGLVVLLIGAIIIWIGVRGTQGSIYADIFGHPYVPAGNTPSNISVANLPADSSIGINGPAGGSTQGSTGTNSIPGWSNVTGPGSTSVGPGTPLGPGSIGGGVTPPPTSGAGSLAVPMTMI